MDNYLNDKNVKDILKQLDKTVTGINTVNGVTVIEFEDGNVLPLSGAPIEFEKTTNLDDNAPSSLILRCSFCNAPSTTESPVISPPNVDYPLICPRCAVLAVQTFIKHGVKMDLKFSI